MFSALWEPNVYEYGADSPRFVTGAKEDLNPWPVGPSTTKGYTSNVEGPLIAGFSWKKHILPTNEIVEELCYMISNLLESLANISQPLFGLFVARESTPLNVAEFPLVVLQLLLQLVYALSRLLVALLENCLDALRLLFVLRAGRQTQILIHVSCNQEVDTIDFLKKQS